MFKYHLNDVELDDIQLVLESGEVFEFPDIVHPSSKRKRDRKHKDKERKGIEVTDAVQHHKDKKSRWLTLLRPGHDECKFISSKSTGRLYNCDHCSKTLQRMGKS
jgi:hypothetical protein